MLIIGFLYPRFVSFWGLNRGRVIGGEVGGGRGDASSPHFFAKQKKIKNKNAVNRKINKKHEIVKRSHHSIEKNQ